MTMHIKDLRGVECPLNFIKSKVELQKLAVNEELTLFLDDGEAMDNVPRSLELEGHEIISTSWEEDNYWKVVVQKKH